MKSLIVSLFAVCVLAVFGSASSNQQHPTPAMINTQAQFPLSFEPNRGQTDSRVRYVSRGREGTMFFTADGAFTVVVPKHGSFRLELEGARQSANFETENPLPGRTNYLSKTVPPQFPLPMYRPSARCWSAKRIPALTCAFTANHSTWSTTSSSHPAET